MTPIPPVTPAPAGFFEPVEDFCYQIETVIGCANRKNSGETCNA